MVVGSVRATWFSLRLRGPRAGAAACAFLLLATVASAGCRRSASLPHARRSASPPDCAAAIVWDTTRSGWPSERLAQRIPEFGSAYVDTVLKVYLTDMRAADSARQIIDRYNLYHRRGREVRYILGTYSYRQLRAWINCLLPYLGPGIASVGVWERDNRVQIVVVDEMARRRIEAAIAKLRLARAAFIIEKGNYARPTAPTLERGWGGRSYGGRPPAG